MVIRLASYLGKLKPLEKAKKGDVSWKASTEVATRLDASIDRVCILLTLYRSRTEIKEQYS